MVKDTKGEKNEAYSTPIPRVGHPGRSGTSTGATAAMK
jgi:hypothetical protein